jgi:hypothetical protein
MLSGAERSMIADAAAREWDGAAPRWSMSRERFIAWHVGLAEKSALRMARNII